MSLSFDTFFRRISLLLVTLFFTGSIYAVGDTEFLNDTDHKFVFDIDALSHITLVFSESEWQLLLQSSRDEANEVQADFVFKKGNATEQVSSIGVKVSGNTSFVLPEQGTGNYQQAHFSLDFDQFVDDQVFYGLSKLRLKRFHNDATFVHEPLSNHLMQNFNLWTAHSSTYVKLSIKIGSRNEAYFGVYRMNESVNRKEYIDKRFGTENDKGMLWQGNHKSTGAAHFSNIRNNWSGIDTHDNATFEFKGKDEDFSEAKYQLIEISDNFTNLSGTNFDLYVSTHINMPLFLKFLAAEAVLGHWDGFWGNGNNYFFYVDEQQVVHFIPYDTDNALGTSLFVSDVGEQDPLHFALPDKTPTLVTKVLAIERFRTEFKALIEQMVTQYDLMTEQYATNWIRDAHQLIEFELQNDTGDNQEIADRPANWGNQDTYRLFDLHSGKNWYSTRKSAILQGIESDNHIYPSMFLRGVTNHWGKTAMVGISDNIWQVTVHNDESTNASGVPRFKFDVYADWTINFGDSDENGIVDLDGEAIPFDNGYGEYLIRLDVYTGEYSMVRTDLPNAPPVAAAGPDIQVVAGDNVTLNAASSSDSDGQIVEFLWSIGASGELSTVQFIEVGTYEITLTVTDERGGSASDTLIVTVIAPPEEKTSAGTLNQLLLLLLISMLLNRRHEFKTRLTGYSQAAH